MSPNNDFEGDAKSSEGNSSLLSQLGNLFGRGDSSNKSTPDGHLESVKPLQVPKRGKIFRYLIYTLVVVGLIGVVIFIYIPQQQQKSRQQSRLAEVGSQSVELQRLEQELAVEKGLLVASKEKFVDLTARAYTQKELDRLFGNISYLANEYQLLIDRIEQQSLPASAPNVGSKIQFSVIQINLNVSGKYLNYLTFRRALFGANKAIDMPSEKIQVLPNSNSVQVVGVLRVYLISGEEEL